jgi:hypothetical protein
MESFFTNEVIFHVVFGGSLEWNGWTSVKQSCAIGEK